MYEKYIFVVIMIIVEGLSAFLYISLNVLILCCWIMGLEHELVTLNLTKKV